MNQNPKVWEINGISLPLDLDDADAMEAYEEAFELMALEEEELPREGKASVRMRAYCEMYRKLFLDIFGDEALPLFEGVKDNVNYYESLYTQFLDFVQTQTTAAVQKRAQMLSKYTPNRAQKRNAT